MSGKEIALIGDECMTVREVAEALGVSVDTVRSCIRRIMPEKMMSKKTTYLSKKEVAKISKSIKDNGAVMSHLSDEVSSSVKTTFAKGEAVSVNLWGEESEEEREAIKSRAWELIKEDFARAKARMANLETENRSLHSNLEEKQTLLDEHRKWQSVKRFCLEHDLHYDLPTLKAFGKDLAVICRRKGITPKKVDDCNYGFVNAYPIGILYQFFDEDLED